MKKIYYTWQSAAKACKTYIRDNGILNFSVHYNSQIDDKENADEDADFTANVGSWSGSMSCITLLDENGQILAKFGFWEGYPADWDKI